MSMRGSAGGFAAAELALFVFILREVKQPDFNLLLNNAGGKLPPACAVVCTLVQAESMIIGETTSTWIPNA